MFAWVPGLIDDVIDYRLVLTLRNARGSIYGSKTCAQHSFGTNILIQDGDILSAPNFWDLPALLIQWVSQALFRDETGIFLVANT